MLIANNFYRLHQHFIDTHDCCIEVHWILKPYKTHNFVVRNHHFGVNPQPGRLQRYNVECNNTTRHIPNVHQLRRHTVRAIDVQHPPAGQSEGKPDWRRFRANVAISVYGM